MAKTNESHIQPLTLRRDDGIPPIVTITGFAVAEVASQWKPRKTQRENPISGAPKYRTVFRLYFAPRTNKYFLHKLGESSISEEITRYSIIEFSTPPEFLAIINNEADHRVHPSRPLIELLSAIVMCPHLTPEQVEAWNQLLLVEG
jgi:hypothetical protein